jgi:hypothetical protein
MNTAPDMLQDPASLPLRDIHLPAPPSWWPPAPGWWVLATLAIVLPLAWLAWRHLRRRTALRRAALRELDALRRLADDPPRLAQETSLLLRRISLAFDPAHTHVTVTGDAWLSRLRALAPGLDDGRFADALLVAPYAARTDIDAPALLAALERWIRALPPPRPVRARAPHV